MSNSKELLHLPFNEDCDIYMMDDHYILRLDHNMERAGDSALSLVREDNRNVGLYINAARGDGITCQRGFSDQLGIPLMFKRLGALECRHDNPEPLVDQSANSIMNAMLYYGSFDRKFPLQLSTRYRFNFKSTLLEMAFCDIIAPALNEVEVKDGT